MITKCINLDNESYMGKTFFCLYNSKSIDLVSQSFHDINERNMDDDCKTMNSLIINTRKQSFKSIKRDMKEIMKFNRINAEKSIKSSKFNKEILLFF